jgi:RimJ/RimL family protein N-acetyltransferase
MFGPRIAGDNGIELRPPVLEDYHFFSTSQMQPEVTRFWGPRFTSETPAAAEESLKKDLEGKNSVLWSIAYQGETVGFTGIFDINWASRDGETGKRCACGWRSSGTR